MSLLSLGLNHEDNNVSFWSILTAKWDAVLAISLITLLFTMNEIRLSISKFDYIGYSLQVLRDLFQT